jgi:hypothetical protein
MAEKLDRGKGKFWKRGRGMGRGELAQFIAGAIWKFVALSESGDMSPQSKALRANKKRRRVFPAPS